MWSGSMRTILIFPLSQRTRGTLSHSSMRCASTDSAAPQRCCPASVPLVPDRALGQRTPALSDEAAELRARVMLQIVRSMK